MSNLTIPLNSNTQLRNLITMLDSETDKNVRLFIDGLIYVKLTNKEHKELVDDDIGNPKKDHSQFYSVPCQKYPNRMYVALGRKQTAKMNRDIVTGNYEPIEPWKFWRWVDKFGIANLFIELPQVEEIDN